MFTLLPQADTALGGVITALLIQALLVSISLLFVRGIVNEYKRSRLAQENAPTYDQIVGEVKWTLIEFRALVAADAPNPVRSWSEVMFDDDIVKWTRNELKSWKHTDEFIVNLYDQRDAATSRIIQSRTIFDRRIATILSLSERLIGKHPSVLSRMKASYFTIPHNQYRQYLAEGGKYGVQYVYDEHHMFKGVTRGNHTLSWEEILREYKGDIEASVRTLLDLYDWLRPQTQDTGPPNLLLLDHPLQRVHTKRPYAAPHHSGLFSAARRPPAGVA